MARVFIGVDPHRLSVTIEVVDHRARVLANGRFGTDKAGYAAMRIPVAAWPERVWAIEGCQGIGRHIAMRLLRDPLAHQDRTRHRAHAVRQLRPRTRQTAPPSGSE